jgi:uncharacterized protein
MRSLLYLHGFRSSNASRKAQALEAALREIRADWEFLTPNLPFDPAAAIAETERLAKRCVREELTIIGSSLGGYYAALLAGRIGCRAVLLNPALHPDESLASHLGMQTNLYTGEAFEFTSQHLAFLRDNALRPPIDAANMLAVVELGDELLDHHRTRAELMGARVIAVEGGNHDLASFPEHMPAVLTFAGLPP